MSKSSAVPLLPGWGALDTRTSCLQSIVGMQMPGFIAFTTTCLVLLPVEYRMPIEMALIAMFPQHVP